MQTATSYMSFPGIYKTQRKEYSIESIIKIVSSRLGIEVSSILLKDRHREKVFARQMVCYICTKAIWPRHTTTTVAMALNLHHASVIHGCKVIKGLLDVNAAESIIANKIISEFKN